MEFVDLAADDPDRERCSASTWPAPTTGSRFEELEPRVVLVQLPVRRLPRVHGLGTRMEVDPDLVVPDPDLSLAEGAHRALGQRPHLASTSRAWSVALADEFDFDMDTPFADLPVEAAQGLLHGHDDQVHVRYRNRYGRERAYSTGFEGVDPLCPAAARRVRVGLPAASATRATCARCRARPATAPGSSPCRWR